MDSSPTTSKPALRGPSLRSLTWWTFWLLVVSAFFAHLPYEVGYWMLALAEKSSFEKRPEEARAWVERAKQWMPQETLPIEVAADIALRANADNPLAAIDDELQKGKDQPARLKGRLHKLKSDLLRGREQYDAALAEYDTAAAYIGELRPAFERAELLLQLNRREEAKREIAQAMQKGQGWILGDSVQRDNNTAYFLALVDESLEKALSHAEAAIAGGGETAGLLDTRGFVYYRLKNYEKAKVDFDRAVEDVERELSESKGRLTPKTLESVTRNVALIVFHRSLVLDALGKSAEAERDRQRVKELGFEPDQRLF